jgi:hypothetical protein
MGEIDRGCARAVLYLRLAGGRASDCRNRRPPTCAPDIEAKIFMATIQGALLKARKLSLQ